MADLSPRILVDADACPVRREVERVAARLKVRICYFANAAQTLAEGADRRVIRVDDRRDAADFALVMQCRSGDIVVTDDLGLASMALGAGADALSSRGRRYTKDIMPLLLEQRHVARKARRAGQRTRGPNAFTSADRQRFVRELTRLVQAQVDGMAENPD